MLGDNSHLGSQDLSPTPLLDFQLEAAAEAGGYFHVLATTPLYFVCPSVRQSVRLATVRTLSGLA